MLTSTRRYFAIPSDSTIPNKISTICKSSHYHKGAPNPMSPFWPIVLCEIELFNMASNIRKMGYCTAKMLTSTRRYFAIPSDSTIPNKISTICKSSHYHKGAPNPMPPFWPIVLCEIELFNMASNIRKMGYRKKTKSNNRQIAVINITRQMKVFTTWAVSLCL